MRAVAPRLMHNQLQVNDWIYDKQNKTLSLEGKHISPDPKLIALLDYFVSRPDELISRDELLDNVWAGTVVSDNTVNWSVSQLRKILGDNASSPSFIKTEPKRGYRFIANVKALDVAKPASSEITPAPVSYRQRLFWPLAALMLILLIVVNFWQPSAPDYGLDTGQLLTRLPGLEENPDLSADKALLLFRHQPTGQTRFQLWVKPMFEPTDFKQTLNNGDVAEARVASIRDQSPYPLSQDAFNYRHAVWGADNYQLYAIRTDRIHSPNQCQLVEIRLPISRDRIERVRVLNSCRGGGYNQLAYDAQNNTLFFTDEDASGQYRVYQRDSSGQITTLSTPEQAGRGDHGIDLHPDGQHLLVLRNQHWRETVFMRLDISTGHTDVLFTQPSLYYTAYWGPQGDDIWLNTGNDRVVKYSLDTQQSTRLMASSFGWNYDAKPLRTMPDKAIFAVSADNASELTALKNGALYREALPRTQKLPTYSPDGQQLAFISNHTGVEQIWIKDSDGKLQQISNLTQLTEFSELAWSPSGKQLIGVAEKTIGIIDIEKQQYTPVHETTSRVVFPQLSQDEQRLFFSQETEQGWRLFHVPVSGKSKSAELVLHEPVFHFKWLDEQRLLFNKAEQPGLWLWSSEDNSAVLIDADVTAGAMWLWNQTESGYALNYVNTWGDRQFFTQLFDPSLKAQGKVSTVALPPFVGRRFTYSPTHKHWVLEDWRRLESDLKWANIVTDD